jgi:release factor glutamine methyltransferase
MSPLSPYQQTQLARYGNQAQASAAQLQDMPIEYATGRAEFAGLALHVSPAVLIPRVETEELLGLALEVITEKLHAYQTPHLLQIAEVGTGSGAISIALAKHLHLAQSRVTITAGDISPEALEVARKNQAAFVSPNEPPVQLLISDLLKEFEPHAYDLIIANLPYIPSARIPQLDQSVRAYEPHLALDGGPRGLSLIYRLLDQAITYLKPGGVVLLEVDETHSIVDFRDVAQYFEVTVIQDTLGKNRFVRLTFTQQRFRA